MRRPMPTEPLPPETVRAARAAFPKGHRYPRLADALHTLFTDAAFQALFPRHGQPAWALWRLAPVAVLQLAEGLSDRQAARAVRSRLDRKYVLRLALTDPGFDASLLGEFRTRLIAGAAESLLLETLLTRCRDRQLVQARGRQQTDSTLTPAAVRALNRLEAVGETLRHALNTPAVVAPAWLRTVAILRSIQARCILAKPTTVPVVRSTRPPGPFLALRHEALEHNHVPAFSTHEGVVRVQVRHR
jgi:transposase